MKYVVAIILLVVLFHGSTDAGTLSDRFLEVVWTESEVVSEGEVRFTGEVRNTSDSLYVAPLWQHLVLKKGSKVVYIRQYVVDDDNLVEIDEAFLDYLPPGGTAPFSFTAYRSPDVFDDYYVFPTGLLHRDYDLFYLTWDELDSIEGWSGGWAGSFDDPNIVDYASVGLVEYDSDYAGGGGKEVFLYFEMINRINAGICVIRIALDLFDAEGALIGWAVASYQRGIGVRPYGRLPLVGGVIWRDSAGDLRAADIASWSLTEVEEALIVSPFYLGAEQGETTAVQDESWGAIKARMMTPAD